MNLEYIVAAKKKPGPVSWVPLYEMATQVNPWKVEELPGLLGAWDEEELPSEHRAHTR